MNSIVRLTFAIALVVVFQSARAQDKVRIVIGTDKANYTMNESLTLTARIVNNARGPTTVYGSLEWGELAGFVLEISDSKGKQIHPSILDDDLTVPSTFDNERYYVTLRRNHYFGATRKDNLSKLVPGPGTYTLKVRYRSPLGQVDRPLVKDMLLREVGWFTSNAIKVSVAP